MSSSTAPPVEMISNIHTSSLKKEIMSLEIKLAANVTICSSFTESEDKKQREKRLIVTALI